MPGSMAGRHGSRNRTVAAGEELCEANEVPAASLLP